MAKLAKERYGIVELNQVTARRTGENRAQYPLKATQFPAATPAENGMLLVIDDIKGEVALPGTAGLGNVYLNYSVEKMYNQFDLGLKTFSLSNEDGTYPRLAKLTEGDIITTNTVELGAYTLGTLATALAVPTAIAGYAHTNGYIFLAEAGAAQDDFDVLLQVQKITTLPDGQVGIKFVVVRA